MLAWTELDGADADIVGSYRVHGWKRGSGPRCPGTSPVARVTGACDVGVRGGEGEGEWDDVRAVEPHFFVVGVVGEGGGVGGAKGADCEGAGEGKDWWGVSWACEWGRHLARAVLGEGGA